MTTTLPLFYFRPTICCIDDDPLFLDALTISLTEHYNCITFSKPEEALQFFTSYQSPLSMINFTHDLIESDFFGLSNQLPVNTNLSKITQLENLSQKEAEISVLIVDQNMPKRSGLEVCKKLKNSLFKKILLTGETSHEKAVEAFNQGLINKFIHKDKVVSQLEKSIQELTSQFFHERTAHLLSQLESSRLSPLSDPIFVDFFKKWRESNKIQEFYLINKQGSFLTKDNQGKSHYFVVLSEHDRSDFIRLNDEISDKVGPLLNRLAMGEIIPFFGIGKECWEFDFNNWGQFFYPANTIQGRENYYWTAITC